MIVFTWLRWRLSRNVDALTPVVTFHRAVGGISHRFHPRNRSERVVELAEECVQLRNLIPRHLRIDMQNIAVRGIESEVLLVQVAQALCQQAGCAQPLCTETPAPTCADG